MTRMTQAQERAFICIDEWLGVALCLYLRKTGDHAFWPAFAAFVLSVYVMSYFPYWRRWGFLQRGPVPEAPISPATLRESEVRLVDRDRRAG